MTVIVLPFHHVGYCNSTAPIEAKLRKNFKLYSPPRAFSSFPVAKSQVGGGGLITQYYALRNVSDSVLMTLSVGTKTIVLSSSKEKKETCSYPRTAQHHATCHCPFASSSSRILSSILASSSPRFFRFDTTAICVRLSNLHPYDRASISRYSISLMKIIASYGERSEMKSSRSQIGK